MRNEEPSIRVIWAPGRPALKAESGLSTRTPPFPLALLVLLLHSPWLRGHFSFVAIGALAFLRPPHPVKGAGSIRLFAPPLPIVGICGPAHRLDDFCAHQKPLPIPLHARVDVDACRRSASKAT